MRACALYTPATARGSKIGGDSGETAFGMLMSFDEKLRRKLEQMLTVVDEREGRDTQGPRLLDDAARLWRRVGNFISMGLVTAEPDIEALELSCMALQFPMRSIKAAAGGKMGRISLRDRAEQAAELLTEAVGGEIDESLLDRTARLLHETPQHPPVMEDAKLLADAVNLDDYGVIGFSLQAIQLARQGDGIAQLIDGLEKREQYGYWEARLKDGFHYEIVRRIAQARLEHLRQAAGLLSKELAEDGPVA